MTDRLQQALEVRAQLRRAEILARARAATANDPPQVVGYSPEETAHRERTRAELRATIERLQRLRALWSPEDRMLAAQRAVRAGGERSPILPPPPEPEPEPARDAGGPPTMRSAGCGLESPPDTHQPFPLTRVPARSAPSSRAPASPAGSGSQRPTEPRQPAAAPPGPTMRERLSARLARALQGLLWVGLAWS